MAIFPAKATRHTEGQRTSAKSPRAAPFCATVLGYSSGLLPLRRSSDYGRRNSWATMLLRESRPRFRPAVVDPSSGAKNRSWPTSAAARHVGSLALVIFPPVFTAHPADLRTSGRIAASGEASLTSSLWVFFPLRRNGDRPRHRSWATMLLRNSRLRCCSAGVDPIDWGKQTSERTLRGGGISAASALRPPPRTYPCKEAKSDVREKRRSRTN